VIVWIEDDYYREATTQEIRLLRTIVETQRPILAEERRFWRSLKPGWNLVITPLDNISQLPHDIEEFADEAAERTQILWGQDDGWQMIGPVRRGNYLYVAVARRGWQGLFEDEDRWVIPIAVILVVTLMCSLLAWSMTRPVRRLQGAVKQLARGDFDMSELNKTYRRHDEIGVLTQEVIDMADALQRLLQSHQQLLRDVSHELRSPLTRLQIALAIARKKIMTTYWPESMTALSVRLGRLITSLVRCWIWLVCNSRIRQSCCAKRTWCRSGFRSGLMMLKSRATTTNSPSVLNQIRRLYWPTGIGC
jgi:two-component system sensor histidine kinase CpxA